MGGTPAAWGATLLFFQLALIIGYATVDWALRTGGARRVRVVHLAALGVASLALVAHAPFAGEPTPGAPTLLTALGMLASGLGLPVVALAFTAPAAQAWLAARASGPGRESYVLYAASNAGSLAGLLAFPWLIEPVLSLGDVWSWWRIGIWVLAVVAALLWFGAGVPRDAVRPPAESLHAGPGTRLRWVARAAVPAALLLGVTDYLTRDLAPVPMLWVLPLALYLVTWIVAFSPRTHGLVSWATRHQDVAAVATLILFLNPPWALVGPLAALLALTVIGIAQHGALAAEAPPAAQLGRFYVHLAVGGALGTAFVVGAGPALFPLPIETPVALVAAILLGRPPATTWSAAGRNRFLAFAVLAVAVPFVAGMDRQAGLASLSIAAGALAMLWRGAPIRVGAVLAALIVVSGAARLAAPDYLGGARNLLGRFSVLDRPAGISLVSGSTLHGLELRERTGRPEATLYYSRHGPYGDLVRLVSERHAGPGWRFGVVGLGIGSLGCTAPIGTAMTYFEINPEVVRLARDTSLFRSLTVCSPDAVVRLGDARLTLAAGDDRFDLLTLDAFNSDAIPTHLLTREAFAVYRERLAPGGIVAFHVSNRFLDLAPVVAAVAHEAGWVVAQAVPRGAAEREALETHTSDISMVAVAAEHETLAPLVAGDGWRWMGRRDSRPWTDDWTPLASALRIGWAEVLGR